MPSARLPACPPAYTGAVMAVQAGMEPGWMDGCLRRLYAERSIGTAQSNTTK